MGGGNVTVTAVWLQLPASYVNAVTGNDGNLGTSGAPFKTITKALSVAPSYSAIFVAPGSYNASNGETFPLVLPTGVNLVGDPGTRGSTTVIQGGAQVSGPPGDWAVVVMGTNTLLAGFTVTSSSPVSGHFAIIFSGLGNAIAAANAITGNDGGIYVWSGSGGYVDNNVFSANPHFDLAYVNGAGLDMCVSNNSFTARVELDNPSADLGGGAANSPGHNSFLAVTNPTYFGTGGKVYARNNQWRNFPPTTGTWGAGDFDVATAGSTTVDTTGYY